MSIITCQILHVNYHMSIITCQTSHDVLQCAVSRGGLQEPSPHCGGSHGGGQVHYTGNGGDVIKARCKLGIVKRGFYRMVCRNGVVYMGSGKLGDCKYGLVVKLS